MSNKINLKELRAWDWYKLTYRMPRTEEAREAIYQQWKKEFLKRTYKDNSYRWLNTEDLINVQIRNLRSAYKTWVNNYAYDTMIELMNSGCMYPVIKMIGKMPLWLYKAGAYLLLGLTQNESIRSRMRSKAIQVMEPFMRKLKVFLDNLPRKKYLGYTDESIGLVDEDSRDEHCVFSYHDWRMPENWTDNLDEGKTYIGFEFETNLRSKETFNEIMETLISEKIIDDEKVKLVPTSDASINGNFPVEWVSCPMEPKEAIKVFNTLKKLLKDNHCQYGREACAGALHIHFSRTENNKKVVWKLLNKLNNMSLDELEEVFGKQSSYCGKHVGIFRNLAEHQMFQKLNYINYDTGKITIELDLEKDLADFVGGGHGVNLNFQHKYTYELRTPDGTKDLSVYLEWLKQQGVDLDL